MSVVYEKLNYKECSASLPSNCNTYLKMNSSFIMCYFNLYACMQGWRGNASLSNDGNEIPKNFMKFIAK